MFEEPDVRDHRVGLDHTRKVIRDRLAQHCKVQNVSSLEVVYVFFVSQ